MGEPTGETSAVVPGHWLVSEGEGCNADGHAQYSLRADESYVEGPFDRGKCGCGKVSPPLPSKNARRRWHRVHKAALLVGQETVGYMTLQFAVCSTRGPWTR